MIEIVFLIIFLGFVGFCMFILIKMGKALHRGIKDADIIIKILAVLGAAAVTFIVAMVNIWVGFLLMWYAGGKGPMLH
jgi:hypothetical protein